MTKFFAAIGFIPVAVAVLVGISLLLSWPVYFLWNHSLVGAVDGVYHVTWVQAWGLTALCSLLFKSSVTNKKDE